MWAASMKIIFFQLFFFFNLSLYAESLEVSINEIESAWAKNHFSTKSADEKLAKFRELIGKIDILLKEKNESAELLLWRGILRAGSAEYMGPFDALDIIKLARTDFEKSVKLNPNVIYASAYINLGILYTEVPEYGFSSGYQGFGDLKKAEKMFENALTIEPNSIDVNYYYGRLMEKNENYSEAAKLYEKALSIKSRPHQKFADDEQKREVLKQLIELKKNMGISENEYMNILQGKTGVENSPTFEKNQNSK
jgi:tetratricopeptide (TPR) repeat protein